MRRVWHRSGYVNVGLCLLAFTCPLGADEPAGPKAASTPEQAVELLEAASKAGDLAGALHQIAQPFQDVMLSMILMEEADDVLNAALDEAFGKEPPAGFRMEVKRDLLRIQSAKILAKEVVSDKRVKLLVRETVKSFHHEGEDIAEMYYLAVNNGERWTLFRPFTALVFGATSDEYTRAAEQGPDGKEITIHKIKFQKELDELGREMVNRLQMEGKQLPELLARQRRIKEAAEKIAQDIRAGKYTSRDEAFEAFQCVSRAIKD